MSLFDAEDFAKLRTLFDSGYAGYRPEVVEAPNGDGKLDTQKRYLHVRSSQDGIGGAPVFIGEIGELVGLGPATPHAVPPRPYEQQSIVFFAMPPHGAVLPDGRTVGTWLAERLERSRYSR